jgi:hypothetical protein
VGSWVVPGVVVESEVWRLPLRVAGFVRDGWSEERVRIGLEVWRLPLRVAGVTMRVLMMSWPLALSRETRWLR